MNTESEFVAHEPCNNCARRTLTHVTLTAMRTALRAKRTPRAMTGQHPIHPE